MGGVIVQEAEGWERQNLGYPWQMRRPEQNVGVGFHLVSFQNFSKHFARSMSVTEQAVVRESLCAVLSRHTNYREPFAETHKRETSKAKKPWI
jgi:hypothetical protein